MPAAMPHVITLDYIALLYPASGSVARPYIMQRFAINIITLQQPVWHGIERKEAQYAVAKKTKH